MRAHSFPTSSQRQQELVCVQYHSEQLHRGQCPLAHSRQQSGQSQLGHDSRHPFVQAAHRGPQEGHSMSWHFVQHRHAYLWRQLTHSQQQFDGSQLQPAHAPSGSQLHDGHVVQNLPHVHAEKQSTQLPQPPAGHPQLQSSDPQLQSISGAPVYLQNRQHDDYSGATSSKSMNFCPHGGCALAKRER